MIEDHPLTITAEIGGRERKFLASTLGTYRALKRHGYGSEEVDVKEMIDKLEKRRQEMREAEEKGEKPPMKVNFGALLTQKMEEVWMASLHYEDVSLDEFFLSIPMNELGKISDIWRELQEVQNLPMGDAETLDSSAVDGKKKRSGKSSKTG